MARLEDPGPPKVRVEEPPAPRKLKVGDAGLEEPDWDISQSLQAGAIGTGFGAAAGGLPGALAGGVGGFSADVLYQIASNQAKGLPWWLHIPVDVTAMILTGHLGGALGNKVAGKIPAKAVKVPESDFRLPSVETGQVAGPPSAPRKLTTSELLEEAARSQTPAPAKESLTSRLLTQAKEIDTGSRPHFMESAEDRVRRLHYGPVETRPLYKPTEIPGPYEHPVVEDIAPEAAARATRAAKAVDVEGTPASSGNKSVWQDVRNWTQGAQELVGHYASPILSMMERVDEVIGKELVGLEGRKAHIADTIWNELFEDLAGHLRKLPKQYYDNFIDTLEGKTQAAAPVVDEAVGRFRQVFGDQGSALLAQQKAGLDVDPLMNYFMHEFDPAFIRGLVNDSKKQTEWAKKLVADGVALDVHEARRMVSDFMSRPSRSVYRERKVGSEFDRTKNLTEYIRDPLKAVTMRGKAITRRLAELEVYGSKQENVRNLINQLDKDKGQRMTELFRLTMGRDPVNEGMQRVANKLMSFNAITSLSLSGIMNMSQPSLLMLRTSIPNMAKGIFQFLANPAESMRAAQELGVYADMAQRVLMQELTGGFGGKMTRGALGAFNWSEKFVRAMAAQAGKDWARMLQTRYLSQVEKLSPKEMTWLTRELSNLNFTKPEIQRLVADGGFTPNDVKLVAWSIADQTSFLPRAARKSEFYLKSPIGPVILQFKNFLLNTGRLLKTTIFDEAARGNYQPMYRAVGIVLPAMAALGEIPADVSVTMRGSRRPVTDLTSPGSIAYRAVDNIAQIGALGLGLNLLQEMSGIKNIGTGDVAKLVTGPSISLLGEGQPLVKAGYNAVSGDAPEARRQMYEAMRTGVRRIPYLGPIAGNQVFPSSRRSASEDLDTWMDRLGMTRRVVSRDRMRRLDSRLRHLTQ